MLAIDLASRWPQVALFSEVTSSLPLRAFFSPLPPALPQTASNLLRSWKPSSQLVGTGSELEERAQNEHLSCASLIRKK